MREGLAEARLRPLINWIGKGCGVLLCGVM